MNIEQLFSNISYYIIYTYKINFNIFFSEDIEVKVQNNYPMDRIDLIRREKLNPKIKYNNNFIYYWSEEYQKVDNSSAITEYYISLGNTHEQCYQNFRYYFDILATGQFKSEAQKKFDEYYFYLNILLKHSNLNYTTEFKKYWHKFLLSVKDQIQNQPSNLSNIIASTLNNNSLTQSNVNELLTNLNNAINLIKEN